MCTFTPAAMDVKRITNSYITMWLCGFSSFDYSCNSYKITCKAKPDCSPPGGYPPHRLLIINRWANWFACVRRSTCTSCRISSHASVGKCPRWDISEREMSEGECPRGKCQEGGIMRGEMSVPKQGQCLFRGVLVLSAEIVAGRRRVLYLRWSSASWLNAREAIKKFWNFLPYS